MPENSKIDFYNRKEKFAKEVLKLDNWVKYPENKELIET